MAKLKTRDLIICALFTSLIAAGAMMRIPIPMVPFTLQFLFTNLAGLLLGRRLGATSVLTYVLIGLLGVPVFTGGGGIGYVLQPTFGYLIGFILGAWTAGRIVERAGNFAFKTCLTASFVNLAIVYAIGIVYYFIITSFYLKSPMGLGALFFYCFATTVPGDAVLCFFSAVLVKRVGWIVRGEYRP